MNYTNGHEWMVSHNLYDISGDERRLTQINRIATNTSASLSTRMGTHKYMPVADSFNPVDSF